MMRALSGLCLLLALGHPLLARPALDLLCAFPWLGGAAVLALLDGGAQCSQLGFLAFHAAQCFLNDFRIAAEMPRAHLLGNPCLIWWRVAKTVLRNVL